MFDATLETIEPGKIVKYHVTHDGLPLTFREVLELWQADAAFVTHYNQLLAAAEFSGYRWETPSVSTGTLNRTFEFVLLNCSGFCSRRTDQVTYKSYFTSEEADGGVVAFDNLSGDARLIVPSPRTDISAYGHLAAFVRNGPPQQLGEFWRVVGQEVQNQISGGPLWLSTAGGGVAWLHVRLDSSPKYYGYSPFKKPQA